MNFPKIGIAPETVHANDDAVVLKDRRPERVRRHQRDNQVIMASCDAVVERPKLLIVGGDLPPDEPQAVAAASNPGDPLTWPKYLEWRKTKCRPYDYERGPAMAIATDINQNGPFDRGEPMSTARALEEIDQATHEFVGKIAELGELFIKNGPSTFYGENRDKLIDECGDILFCGAWVLDAWGKNPLAKAIELELIVVGDGSDLAQMAQILATRPQEEAFTQSQFISLLQMVVLRIMLQAQSSAGLLCNSFKKLRYQRREQNVDQQVARVCAALVCVSQILVIANSSTEEALLSNQKKLDARYPDGYKPGQGGGDRAGKGA